MDKKVYVEGAWGKLPTKAKALSAGRRTRTTPFKIVLINIFFSSQSRSL